jgi:hypothetical protein
MTNPRKNAGTTRGKPFAHGNPGRPRGSRHKATLAAEALLEGEAEALTRAAIQKAKEGDTTALRLCLERLVPPRKDRPIVFDLGKLDGPADALDALRAVLAAMSRGDITPSEAEAVAALLESLRRAHETTELEARIAALEAKHDSGP